ncbi:ABC transporter substrate-binding protein [Aureimonas flava]|uniref:ABC transporter substrate-binding protein n=1 Tax=Aureimonas flava TaxID=2320271 RepID=UPI001459FF11|nr:ABC transporter substrate-binding protein [Aureimonas flava]
MKRLLPAITALLVAYAAPFALAQNLTVGMKGAVDSADPHLLYTPNRNIALQIYEPLIYQDRFLKPQPWLATSWTAVDDRTWEIKLREGVVFSDGTPFTADDVVFSLKRGLSIEGVRTYRAYLKDIDTVEAVDPLTVRIVTRQPSAVLPWNLTTIGMVSAKAADGASAEDFDGGRAAIGTGPYKWVRWTPGQDVVLERNETYWNGEEPWEKVRVRFIANDSARVAALLAGDVDLIDEVPGNLAARVKEGENTALVEDTSVFEVYLTMDRFRDASPYVKGADGAALAKNPFKDAKVREALTLAINRKGIAERIMQGAATPTGQIAPEGFAGYDETLPPAAYDPRRAKALLAEAGYPDGFQLTIHCFNDRFSGDAQSCQAIAQMFSAIGVRTQVETLPASVFYKRANSGGPNGEPEFSMIMSLYGTPTGNPVNSLVNLIQTADKERGLGVSNRGRYSNPEVDALIAKAQASFDGARSEELARQAAAAALSDQAIIPLFFLKSSWGVRKDLTLEPRGDGFIMMRNVRPKS